MKSTCTFRWGFAYCGGVALLSGCSAARHVEHIEPASDQASNSASTKVPNTGKLKISTEPDRAQTPRVLEFAFNVSNLERSSALFKALDFTHRESRTVSGAALDELWGLSDVQVSAARFSLGREVLELREVNPGGKQQVEASHSNDRAFQHLAIIVADMDRAYARLPVDQITRVSDGPQTIPESNPVAGGIRAVYFKDLDGHNLELLWFPENRGNPRWHEPNDELFLGVDHSAIGVTDPVSSGDFYQRLGFSAVGRSLNFGIEQARLSGVADAKVQIVSLAPASGPAVEFLHYLEPGPGRLDVDWASNALSHWEITVEVADLQQALYGLPSYVRKTRAVPVGGLRLGYRWAALAYDPDGHCLRLVER